MHSSNLVLNDQFSSAYARPNLVTVECEVPESELTSGYHAQYAKDSVDWHSWHTGTVAGALRKATGMERQVLLSRWVKPVRLVPVAEVAQMYKDLLEGTGVSVPDNVVPPSLLRELKNVGVPITKSGKVSEDAVQYSPRDDKSVYSYTREEYNNFAWATDNGILSPSEVDAFDSINGERKHGGQTGAKRSADGYYLLEIGKKGGVHNVVAVTSKRFGMPNVQRVYRINYKYEILIEDIREEILTMKNPTVKMRRTLSEIYIQKRLSAHTAKRITSTFTTIEPANHEGREALAAEWVRRLETCKTEKEVQVMLDRMSL